MAHNAAVAAAATAPSQQQEQQPQDAIAVWKRVRPMLEHIDYDERDMPEPHALLQLQQIVADWLHARRHPRHSGTAAHESTFVQAAAQWLSAQTATAAAAQGPCPVRLRPCVMLERGCPPRLYSRLCLLLAEAREHVAADLGLTPGSEWMRHLLQLFDVACIVVECMVGNAVFTASSSSPSPSARPSSYAAACASRLAADMHGDAEAAHLSNLRAKGAARRAWHAEGAAADAAVAAAYLAAEQATEAALHKAGDSRGASVRFSNEQRHEVMASYALPSALERLAQAPEAEPPEWHLDVLCDLMLHITPSDDDPYGWNALHYSIAAGHTALAKRLLERGGDPNAPEGALGLRPLHLACLPMLSSRAQLEKLTCVTCLAQLLADFANGPRHAKVIIPLLKHGAVASAPLGQPELMTLQQQLGGNLQNVTPLHLLSNWTEARLGVVVALVEAGACVNAATHPLGETPLTLAAARCRTMVEILLSLGAQPNLARGFDGARPLEMAISSIPGGGPYTAQHLLDADAEVLPSPQQVALQARLNTRLQYTAELLLHHIINATEIPHFSGDAMQAVALQLMQAVLPYAGRLLDVVWPNSKRATPLLSAATIGREEMVQLLVGAGASLDLMYGAGPFGPAVMQAAISGNLPVLQCLIDAGADLATFRHPSTQYSLVQTAANAGKLEAVMALVSAGAPWRLGPDEPRRIGDSLFYVPDILAVTAPHIKASTAEGRLKLAERMYKRREAAVAASLAPLLQGASPDVAAATVAVALRAGLCSDGKPFTMALAPQAAVAGGSSSSSKGNVQRQQQQGAVSADDLDALAAAIDATGGSSSGTQQASSSSSGGSKKQAKKQKQKAKQQQHQQQQQQQQQQKQRQVASASGSESADDNEQGDQPPAAAGAAAAAKQPANGSQQQLSSQRVPGLAGVQDMAVEAALAARRIQLQVAESAQLARQLRAYLAACQAASSLGRIQAIEAASEVLQQHDSTTELCCQLAHRCQEAAALAAEHGAVGWRELEGAVQVLQQQAGEQAQWLEQLHGTLAGQLTKLTKQHPLTPQQRKKQQEQMYRQQEQQRVVAAADNFARSVDILVALLEDVAAGRSSSSAVQRPSSGAVAAPTVSFAAAMAAAGAADAWAPAEPAAAAAAAAASSKQQHAAPVLQPAALAGVPASTASGAASSSNAAVQTPPAAAPAAAPAPGPAPASLLQNWRGALPPMFTFNRQPSSSSSGGSTQPREQQQPVSRVAAAVAPPAPPAAQPPASVQSPQPAARLRMPAAMRAMLSRSSSPQPPPQEQPQQPAPLQPSPPADGASAAASAAAGGSGGAAGPPLRARKCVVCMERPRSVLLLPCAHIVLCTECADSLQARGQLDSCPYCRSPMQQRIKVHNS